MNPGDWIALAALLLTFLGLFGAGIWWLSRLFAALPGQLAEAVRNHELGCVNHEPKEVTQPQMQVLR